MSTGLRVFRNASALGYGQAVMLVNQLATVPVFIATWGVDLYGEWLLLAALPMYLMMASDLGFSTATANHLTTLVSSNRVNEAIALFQETQAFLLRMWGACLLIVLLMLGMYVFGPFQELPLLSKNATVSILLFLALAVGVSQQQAVWMSLFRAHSAYARAVLWSEHGRLLEVGSLVVVLMLGASPIVLAFTILAVRSLTFGFIRWQARLRYPAFLPRLFPSSYDNVRPLLRPALHFALLPLSRAMTNQGLILLVGSVLNPAAVVLFATTRTVCNVAFQFMSLAGHAVWPEITAALGAGQLERARMLHRTAFQFSVALSIGVAIVLFFGREPIFAVWLGQAIQPSATLMGLLLLGVVGNSMWRTSSIVLVAVNAHAKFSVLSTVGSALALGLASILIKYFDLPGVAISLLLLDVILIGYTLPAALRLLMQNCGEFIRQLTNISSVRSLFFAVSSRV